MSNSTRIVGLSGTIDTESMIEQLMSAASTPLNELKKDETKVEWKREALLDINSQLLTFRSAASDMKLQGTYKTYSAESTDSGIVSATTTTEAQEGTYKVTVSQLATKTTLTGTSMPLTITSSSTISSTDRTNLAGKEFNVTYNGETKSIVLDESISSFSDLTEQLQTKIDDAFGSGQITVSKNGYNKLSFSSSTSLNLPVTLTAASDSSDDALQYMHITSGASTAFDTSKTLGEFLSAESFTDGKVAMTVNGVNFEFSESTALSEVFSTINKSEDSDLTIKYSDVKNFMVISRDTYGEGRQLTVSGGGGETGEFWEKLGLDYYNYVGNNNIADFESAGGSYVGGQNAVFSITSPDGEIAADVETASNTFTYNGISMTFLEADPNKQVSITVSKNVDDIYDKIKTFVDSYNDILTTLNKYYKEETTSYEPLTDDEQESLSDTQIEKWEKLAKQGILKRDSALQSAISSLRTAVTSYVSGSSLSSLFEIGISTVSYDATNTQNNGKLQIDEDDLKEAIKNDIDGVADLFAGSAKQIQSNKLSNTSLNLNGTSFNVTYGGSTKTLTLSGQYDLSDASSASDFEDYMKNTFTSAFGEGTVSVTVSGGKILFNSLKTVDMAFNTSSEGTTDSTKDALSLFNIKSGASYDTTKRGFAVKVYDICTTAMSSIIDKAGSSASTVDSSTLGQQLDRIKEQIERQEDKLELLEDRYYDQFAAMEEAISQLNSQSSSITNLLSGS